MKSNVIRRIWAWIMVACMLFTMVPTSFAEEAVELPVEPVEVTEPAPEESEPAPEANEEPAPEAPAQPDAPQAEETQPDAAEEPEADAPAADDAPAAAPSVQEAPSVEAPAPQTAKAKAYTNKEAIALLTSGGVMQIAWTGAPAELPETHKHAQDPSKQPEIIFEGSCEPDAEVPRVIKYTCTCGATEFLQQTVEHVLVKDSIIEEGKCEGTKDKYNVHCENCSYKGTQEYDSTKKHQFGAATPQGATCTDNAHMIAVCSVCQAQRDDGEVDDSSLGHHWVQDTTVVENCVDGWTEKWYCDNENCTGKVNSPQQAKEGEQAKNPTGVETFGNEGKTRAIWTEEHEAGGQHTRGESQHIAATCIAAGQNAVLCSVCGAVIESTPIPSEPALNHLYSDTWLEVEGTSGLTHAMYRECIRDNCPDKADSRQETQCFHASFTAEKEHQDKTEVKWKWGTTYSAANCTTPQINTYYCTACGWQSEVRGKDLDPDKHDWIEVKDIDPDDPDTYYDMPFEPSCQTPGVVRKKCAYGCGTPGAYVQIPSGHKWVKQSGSSNSEPSCTKPGTIVYVCANETCPGKLDTDTDEEHKVTYDTDPATKHARKTEISAALGHRHKNDDGTETVLDTKNPKTATSHVDSTCVTAGSNTWDCDYCDYVETVELPLDPDNHEGVDDDQATQVIMADCMNPSLIAVVCTACGKPASKPTVVEGSAPLGHIWRLANPEDKPNNCEEDWVRHYVCVRPGCTGGNLYEIDEKYPDNHFDVHNVMEEGSIDYELPQDPDFFYDQMIEGDKTGKAAEYEANGEWVPDPSDDADNPSDMPGHLFYWGEEGENTKDLPADCVNDARTVYICKYCGAEDTSFDGHPEKGTATGHTYYKDASDPSQGTVTKNQEGYDNAGWYDTTPAATPNLHSHSRKCVTCGAVEKIEFVSDTTDQMTVAATCTVPDSTVYRCEKCGWEYREFYDDDMTLDPDFHIFSDPTHIYTDVTNKEAEKETSKVLVEPTCTTKGKKVLKCVLCGKFIEKGKKTYDAEAVTDLTVEIEPTGHNWVLDSATSKEDAKKLCTGEGLNDGVSATFYCGNEGCAKDEALISQTVPHPDGTSYEWDEAKGCMKKVETVTEAIGHTYQKAGDSGDFVLDEAAPHERTKEPTCTEQGTDTYTCERCGETQAETVEANGHAVSEKTADMGDYVFKDADCVYPSRMELICPDCGAEVDTMEIEDHTEPTGHNLSKAVLFGDEDCDSADGYDLTYLCTNPNCPGYVSGKTNDNKADNAVNVSKNEVDPDTHKTVAAGTKHMAKSTGHQFGETPTTKKVEKPTCTEDAGTYYKCTVCGKWVRQGPAAGPGETKLDHQYGAWQLDPDSCDPDVHTEANIKKHTHISVCENDATHVLHDTDEDLPEEPAKPTTTYKKTEVPATCSDFAKDKYECEVCGAYYEVVTGDSLDTTSHESNDRGKPDTNDKLISNSGCLAPTVWQEVCDKCEEPIPGKYYQLPAGHLWEEVEGGTEPTCTTAGVKMYICSRGEKCTGKDPNAKEETSEDGKTVTTYGEQGGIATMTVTTRATGHKFEKWDANKKAYVFDPDCGLTPVTVEGDCTNKGTETYTCPVCNETHVEYTDIVADKHNFVANAEMTPITCEQPHMTGGEVCSRCGAPNPASDKQPKPFPSADTKAPGHHWVLQPAAAPTDATSTCMTDVVLVYVCDGGTSDGKVCCGYHKEAYEKTEQFAKDEKVVSDLENAKAGDVISVVYDTNENGVATKTVTTKAPGHTAGRKETKPADCLHNAMYITYCSVCNEVMNEEDVYEELTKGIEDEPNKAPYAWAKATGHKFEGEWKDGSESGIAVGQYHFHYRFCANENCPGYDPELEAKIAASAGTEQATLSFTLNGKVVAEQAATPTAWGIVQNADAGETSLQPTDWRITTAKETCTTEAGLNYKCPTCGYTFTTVEEKDATETDPSSPLHVKDKDSDKNQWVGDPATCSKPGVKQYYCDHCGIPLTGYFQVAASHVWSKEPVSHTDPTCLKPGQDVYECVREGGCTAPVDGKPATKEVDDKDAGTYEASKYHKWHEHMGQVKNNNYIFEFCEVCGEMRNIQDLTQSQDHKVPTDCFKYEDGVWSGQHMGLEKIPGTPATVTTEGLSDGWRCTVCGEIIVPQTKTDKLPCDHADLKAAIEAGTATPNAGEPAVTAATCMEAGTYHFTCSVCGAKDVEGSYGDPDTTNGHNFVGGEEEVTLEETCTTPGKKNVTCVICEGEVEGGVKEETIQPNPEKHKIVEDKTIPATCEKAGETTYKCSENPEHEVPSTQIPALGHKWGADPELNQANCVTGAFMRYTCERGDACWDDTAATHGTAGDEATGKNEAGVAVKDVPVEGATPDTSEGGHDYGDESEWKTTDNYTAPTCTENGYWTKTCKREGCLPATQNHSVKVEDTSESGKATGHNWIEQVVTYTADFICDVCTKCGEMRNVQCLSPSPDKYQTSPDSCLTKNPDGTWSGKHQKVVELPAVQPEVGKPGKTQGWKCEACGQILKAQQDLDPLQCDHAALDEKIGAPNYDPTTDEEAELQTAATCVAGAVYEIACPTCKTKVKKTIGDPDTVNGHDYVESVDEDGNITYVVGKLTNTVPGNCVDKAVYTYTCTREGCTEGVTANHSKEVEGATDPSTHKSAAHKEAVPATCMAKGHTAGNYCSACENWLDGNETDIDTVYGHNYVLSHDGETITYDEEKGKVTTAADCVTAKVTTYTCTVEGCEAANADKGHTKEVTGTTDASKHKSAAPKEAVPATCMAKGHTAGDYCSACENWVNGSETDIDTTYGHNYVLSHDGDVITYDEDKGDVTTAADCVTAKVTTYTCTVEGCEAANADKGHTKEVTGTVDSTKHKSAKEQPKQDATCVAKGHEAGTYCDACRTWVSGGQDINIDPTAHDYGDDEYQALQKIPANHHEHNCTDNGYWEIPCKNDASHDKLKVDDPNDPADGSGHVWVSNQDYKDGTATYRYCEKCGKVEVTEVKKPEGFLCTEVGHEFEGQMKYAEHDTETKQAVTPTCVTPGSTAGVSCTICSYTTVQPLDPDTENGHSYDEGKPDAQRPATCTEKGYTIYTCQNEGCETANAEKGYTKAEQNIPALGHEWPASTDAEGSALKTAATCVSGAIYTYTCQRQGCPGYKAEPTEGWENGDATGQTEEGHKATKEVNDNTPDLVNGHKFGNWKSADAEQADETNIHVHVGACQNVGCSSNEGQPATKTVKFTVADASDTFTVTPHPATCKTGSYYSYSCTECDTQGDTAEADDKAPHSWDREGFEHEPSNTPDAEHGWYVENTADCVNAGEGYYVCSDCQTRKEHVSIPALGHDWGDAPTSTTPGDCKEEGTATYTCQRDDCPGHTKDDGTDATGEDGDHKATKTEKTGTVPTNHGTYATHEDAESAQAATCTKPGKKADIICEGCNNVKTVGEQIAALGHAWDREDFEAPADMTKDYEGEGYTWKVDIKAKCDKDGSGTYTCTLCENEEGNTKTGVEIPKLSPTGEHSWGEWTDDDDGIHQTSTCETCGETMQQDKPKPSGIRLRVNRPYATLRATASNSGAYVATVTQDTEFDVTGEKVDVFYPILYEGQPCFINENYVEVIED